MKIMQRSLVIYSNVTYSDNKKDPEICGTTQMWRVHKQTCSHPGSPSLLSFPFLSFLYHVSVVPLYVPSSKVLTSRHSSCTQERICWAKEAICEEWGKNFWNCPRINWSFLSSTISYSNVNSRWSYLSSFFHLGDISKHKAVSLSQLLVTCHQLIW